MRKVFNSILSITLALLVLCSTLSFAVEKHFCMGEVIDVSFFAKAQGCEMPMPDNTDLESVKKTSCCSNVVELVESNNTTLKLDSKEAAETIEFTTIFYLSYYNLFIDIPIKKEYTTKYAPPLITEDFNLLYETFLI